MYASALPARFPDAHRRPTVIEKAPLGAKIALLGLLLILPMSAIRAGDEAVGGTADRAYTVEVLDRIARPVIHALAEGKLKENFPIPPSEKGRESWTRLEAFGRTLAGIAPWVALGPDDTPEGKLRAEYIVMCQKALVNATKPDSPDRLNFSKGSQPLVDAAFLAQGLLAAPKQLWDPLNEVEKEDLASALRETRRIKPHQNNWLLFTALVESALWKFTGECQYKGIETAILKHEQWYVGDGVYGDGPQFHWDYYNSYVIQPALLVVLDVCREKQDPLAEHYDTILRRARRYAAVQERLISPEGTFPIIGRSSAYRFGAFQHLAFMAWRHELPKGMAPAGARGGLTAVIRRMVEAPGTFDENGWLRIGVVGGQREIAEAYISTGSLYLCLMGLQHLGLPANDPFWTSPPAPWTQKRIWAGGKAPADGAIK